MTNAALAAARSSLFARSFPQGLEIVNPRAGIANQAVQAQFSIARLAQETFA
jgi:hypothetical protein